jgi:hypothetical protein
MVTRNYPQSHGYYRRSQQRQNYQSPPPAEGLGSTRHQNTAEEYHRLYPRLLDAHHHPLAAGRNVEGDQLVGRRVPGSLPESGRYRCQQQHGIDRSNGQGQKAHRGENVDEDERPLAPDPVGEPARHRR